MVMRIFQILIRPGKEARFFHGTASPLMDRTEGLVRVRPGAARPGTRGCSASP